MLGYMKKNIWFLFLITSIFIHAQKDAYPGIYLNQYDFDLNIVSFQKQEGKKFKLHLNESKHKAMFTLQFGDSLIHFSKDSVFGFVDKHLVTYRLYNRENYKIINPRERILLYSRDRLGGNKGTQNIVEYYFSKTAGDVIYKLTRHNLKQVFNEQLAFKDLIDICFLNEEDLTEFDSESSMYKINSVYIKSQKN